MPVACPSMAFRYGQNYQTVLIYNEIQHIDIEPYIYTLKLKIYISNRIHTNRNYTYEHRTACMYIEPRTYTLKLHIYTSNQIHIHRTKYIYIETTHIYIEPNTHMPKLHIYKWYRSNKSKCIRTNRNNPFLLRTVCLCTSSYFI